jgi:amidase
MKRRDFCKLSAAASAALMITGAETVSAQTDMNSFELEEYTVLQLQEAMRSGKWTARQITQKYLDRIATVDKMLNSVIETNPDALAIADEMDRERKAGKVRSAMHGIPVLIKDNIDTADKMKTTAGSLARRRISPP